MNGPEKNSSEIYRYTAEQALADGALLEVDPQLRREAGYRWSVRITRGVASLLVPEEKERNEGQSQEGRLWDVLWMARIAIDNADDRETIAPFEMILGKNTITLWACLDTTSGPAIHIIRPEEF